MDIAEIPIPPEEYPLLAFGVTWLIDYVMTARNIGAHDTPGCILLDEIPSMAGGEYDLIYWWHKSIEHFPGLENRARIKMIQLAKETKKFDPAELGKYIEIPTASSVISKANWKFRVSRIGIDIGARQAIGHFAVFIDGGGWLNWGCILVMEWGDDNVISLKTVRHTFGPGK
jgi:hypothetical protein